MIFNAIRGTTHAVGIYQITNSVNSKIYVGSTLNMKKRYEIHRRELKENKHHSKPLQAFANKYGIETLTFSLLESCSRETLLEREQHYIDSLGAHYTKGGFNICAVAGSPLGVKRPPEQMKALGARNIGNTYRLGIPHTEESKAKMSASQRKRGPNRAGVEAMRQVNFGNKHNLGRKLTPEEIAKREATRAARRAELGPSYGAKPEDYKIRKSIQMKAKHQAKLAALAEGS